MSFESFAAISNEQNSRTHFFIGGRWVAPASDRRFPLINASTGEEFASVPEGVEADVDRAIAAARAALKMKGILAVWAAQDDRKFEQRLRDGRFDVQVRRLRGRLKKGGPRHTIFLSHKS